MICCMMALEAALAWLEPLLLRWPLVFFDLTASAACCWSVACLECLECLEPRLFLEPLDFFDVTASSAGFSDSVGTKELMLV